MSQANVALVPYPVPAVPASAGAFTGSSAHYWAASTAEAEARQLAQQEEKARIRLRQRQRIFTWMYNVLAVGELVYFIVGLYQIEWQVADLEDNPLLGPGQSGIIKMGGTHTPRIVRRHQYWRLVSSLFHNAGAIHLTANMGMVWSFGHFLVREINPWLVALMFMGAGLAGIMVSANIGAEYATAGASIPAFALAGAASAMLVYRWRRFSCHWASALMVAFILGSNVFIGATPFVDNSGNTAGFVFGAVACMGVMMTRRKATNTKAGEVILYGAAVAAVAIVLAAIVGGLAGLQLDVPIAGCCNPWVCTPSAWWNCHASRICTLTTHSTNSSTLTCPQGNTISVNLAAAAGTDVDVIQEICDALCGNDPAVVSSGDGSATSRRLQ